MTVLVTGASGFVGTGLIARLAADGYSVRGSTRSRAARAADIEWVTVDDAGGASDWSNALRGVRIVIHLAARVHVMHERSADPLTAFRRANVDATIALARQAADAGVARFVFVSSVKVNGESGRFRETDPPNPSDNYGLSKLEAESALQTLGQQAGLEIVIVRPPLVYGPGVGANFQALVRMVRRGVPLPFGSIQNRRSLVARTNLVDFLVHCATDARAPGEVFFVSDGDDVSTPTLVRRIGAALRRRARLVPVPPSLLSLGAAAFGQRAVAERLLGSLQVDITKARTHLGWKPPSSMGDELRRMLS